MKLIKFLFGFFLVVIALITLFWGGIMIVLQTKQGQEWALKHSLAFIENRTGLTFQAEKIEFIFPLTLRLENLSILKESEKLAEIHQIDLSCLYTYLWQGKVICSNLNINRVMLYSSGQIQSPSADISDQRIDHLLPFYLKIENIRIADVRIAPSLIQQLALNERLEHFTFDLKGVISNNPFKSSISAHLLLTATDLTNQFSPIQMGIDAQNGQLSLSLHTDTMPLAETGFNSNLALYAAAPFNTWMNLAKNLSLHDSPVEGRFKMILQDKQTVITSQYRLLSLQEIELYKTLITTPFLELQGESLLDRELVKYASFKGEMHEADNRIFLQGTVKGPYSHLLFDVEANAPQLIIKNQLISNVKVLVTAAYLTDRAQGWIALECESNQIPCKAASGFTWNNNRNGLLSTDFYIEVLESELTGELTIHPSDLMINGYIYADHAPLQPLGQLAGIPLEGLIDLNLIFKTFVDGSSKKQQGVACKLTGNNLHWQELTINQLTLNANWDQSRVDLKTFLQADQIKWKQTNIDQAYVEVDWTNFRKDPEGYLRFTFQNGVDSPWEMKGEGLWHFDKDLIEFNLTQLNGLYANVPFYLLQPIDFSYSPGKIRLAPLNLKWGEGQMSADFSLDSDQFSLNFKTNSISSNLWHTIYPLFPFSGNASAFGHLEGSLQKPEGQVEFEFQNIQISEKYLVKRTSLEGTVQLAIDTKGVSINSQIFGIGRNPLILKGTLPFQLSLSPFTFKENEVLPFSLDINAEGELDTYLHHFVKDFPNISGQAKMAIQLNGKMNKPQVYGNLDVYNATYESQDTGTIYQNINARLEGDGSKIVLRTLSAEDSKGGTITGDGVIEMDEQQNYPYRFNIQASHLYILNSDYASISASGPLSLIGKQKKGKLQGNLKVEHATIQLEEALPKQIKTIDINYINLPVGHRPPLAEANANTALDLDIKLNAAEVLIEGNHLKSSWKGEIEITGNTNQPLLFGDLRISGGEYDLKGKTFNLSQGSIHFAGSAAKKTTLYVVASKEIDPIKVEMIVKGPLNKLGVSFRSNPPMSQREVLSYILFGRGISDITPGEGDTLNQSFVSLNASDASDEKQDLLARIRNNIGIDRLDFTASGEGENKDVSLQVGKYVWKDVLVSLNKSIGAASDRLAIEAKLTKNLKAQAEVEIGSSSQGKVSLKWKRDY